MLGPDLAAAHFIVHRNGAVKFLGDERWYQKDRGWFTDDYKLPAKRDGMRKICSYFLIMFIASFFPDLFIEAIDASKMALVWEGFDNLCELLMVNLLDNPGDSKDVTFFFSETETFETT